MTVKTKLRSYDWFKSYGLMKYPLGSPLGAAILCILPSMHLMSKSTCGSCLDVCESVFPREYNWNVPIYMYTYMLYIPNNEGAKNSSGKRAGLVPVR